LGEDIAVAEASPGEERQAVIHSFIVEKSGLNGGGAAGSDCRGEDRRSRFSRYVFFFILLPYLRYAPPAMCKHAVIKGAFYSFMETS
jgi:hypothetical protein